MSIRTAALMSVALLAAGCGNAVESMTQHWFYGYVTSVSDGEVCLSDARTEDTSAERCFEQGDADLAGLAASDLVKVQYEREQGGGHGGGTAVDVQIVRVGVQPDA